MSEPGEDDPELPHAVQAAGLIWTGVGALGVLASVATLTALLTGTLTESPFGWLLIVLLAGSSVPLLSVGVRTFKGTNPSLGEEGTKSVMGGVLSLIVGLLLLTLSFPLSGPSHWELPLLGGLLLGVGISFILAGSLSLSGRARYEAWRRVHRPAPDDPVR